MRLSLLEYLYDRATEGLPLLGRPAEMAERYQKKTTSPEEAAGRLIQRYTVLCGATGFVCGLPGYVAMPITIPSNLTGVALLQLHMSAAIAALHGRDPRDAAVREHCIDCMFDNLEAPPRHEETEGLISRLTTKLGERGIRFISEQATRWIGRTTGRGTRSLPLVGGAIGGFSDGRSTKNIGRRARRVFLASAPR